MIYAYPSFLNPSTRTNQDEQYQEFHCGSREGGETLDENCVLFALLDGPLSASSTQITSRKIHPKRLSHVRHAVSMAVSRVSLVLVFKDSVKRERMLRPGLPDSVTITLELRPPVLSSNRSFALALSLFSLRRRLRFLGASVSVSLSFLSFSH